MPKTNTNDAPAPTGFDDIVNVPRGQSVDQAIAAAEEIDAAAGAGMAAPIMTANVDFDEGEAAFPRIRLAQGLTAEVADGSAKMGQFLFNGYDPMDEVTLVPIMIGRSRNKRADPNNRDSEIVCSSNDGRVGVGNPGGDCKGCPFARFGSDPRSGRRTAPACSLAYTYAAWCPEVEQFVEMVFSRTSEQAANVINNHVIRQGFGNFAVRLKSTIQMGRNRYAVPQVRLVPLTADLVEGAYGLNVPTPTQVAAPAPAVAAIPETTDTAAE